MKILRWESPDEQTVFLLVTHKMRREEWKLHEY